MDDVFEIQRLYPLVFHACHVRHSRTRSNEFRVSERDHTVLAHLSLDHKRRADVIAAHIGIGAPTLSAAISRLHSLGYIDRERSDSDRREVLVQLTARGRAALQGTSVLDTDRLQALLARLDAQERSAAVAGLRLLARAAEALQLAEGDR